MKIWKKLFLKHITPYYSTEFGSDFVSTLYHLVPTMVVDTVVSKWIHIIYFSPNSVYCLLTNKGVSAYESKQTKRNSKHSKFFDYNLLKLFLVRFDNKFFSLPLILEICPLNKVFLTPIKIRPPYTVVFLRM